MVEYHTSISVTPRNATYDNTSDVTDASTNGHQEIIDGNSNITQSSSSNDNETPSDLFKQNCKSGLLNETMMTNLIDKLNAYDCLQDFVNFVKLLAREIMSPLIIAFLLCLDVARLLSCRTTTQMRFRRATRQFWEVVYRSWQNVMAIIWF